MTLSCGCTPDASGYGYCGKCVAALRAKIWKNMSEERKNYDRHFDPKGSAELDNNERYSECCSCHINPPCSYCTSKNEDEDYE